MNQSSLEALNNASLNALAQEARISVIVVLLSPFTVITNFLIIYVIFRTKELHNKSQYLILLHSAAGMFWGMTMFCVYLKSYIAFNYGFPLATSQGLCKFMNFPIEFFGTMSRRYGLALGMDRLLLVAKPTMYKVQMPIRYLLILHMIVCGPLVVRIPLYFVGYDPYKMISFCNGAAAIGDTYRVFQSVESNVLVALTSTSYALLIVILLYRFKTAKIAGAAQKQEWRRKWEFEVILSIVVIGLIYLSLTAVSNIGFVLFANSPAEVTRIFRDVSTGLAVMSTISHLFVYLGMNGTFREAFQRLVIGRGPNDVIPIS